MQPASRPSPRRPFPRRQRSKPSRPKTRANRRRTPIRRSASGRATGGSGAARRCATIRPTEKIFPAEWNVGGFDDKTGEWKKDKAENIKWVARLGSQSYGNPVVANGHVYVGSNNGAGYLKRYPASIDLGVLLCFDDHDGKFLWQHSNEKLPTGRVHDWPMQGVCATPLVEGKRLWYVTNRGEVVCLDTEGFYDGVDNGPVQNELGRLFEIVKNEDPAKDKVAGLVNELEAGQNSTDRRRAEFNKAGMPLAGRRQAGGDEDRLHDHVCRQERPARGPTAHGRAQAGRLQSDRHRGHRRGRRHLAAEHDEAAGRLAAQHGQLLGHLGRRPAVRQHLQRRRRGAHQSAGSQSAPSFVALDKNTGKVDLDRQLARHQRAARPMVEPGLRGAGGRAAGVVRRRRRLAVQLRCRRDDRRQVEVALEIRLQSQGIEIRARRPGRPQPHHRHAGRSADGHGVYRRGRRSGARRRGGAFLLRSIRPSAATSAPTWPSTAGSEEAASRIAATRR